jgi:hypothetical protein
MFGGPLKILMCQDTGHRENDFAISIKSDDDPGGPGHVWTRDAGRREGSA